MTTSGVELTIREFVSGDEADFRRLNEEWIVRNFALEPKDEEALADPRGQFLDRGGRILIAILGAEKVGCCALRPLGSGEYEVAKMAVAESMRGLGIGRQLMERTIAEARAMGAHRLYLETNSKLTAAVRLYESTGFRHIPAERVVPSPFARANVYMELNLSGH
jgi:putative acetyltransferase